MLYKWKYRHVNVDAGPLDPPYSSPWSKKYVYAATKEQAKILFGLTDVDYAYKFDQMPVVISSIPKKDKAKAKKALEEMKLGYIEEMKVSLARLDMLNKAINRLEF